MNANPATGAPFAGSTARRALSALPFVLPFTLLPVWVLAASLGGWWLLAVPLWASPVMTLLDRLGGLSNQNLDPGTEDSALIWHRAVTWAWVPLQFVVIYGGLWAIFRMDHLSTWEGIGLMVGAGMLSGGIGIVFAHELIHQNNRFERTLGDMLLGMSLYGHFRTEHVHVHHAWVGTPRDAVTARYNESFYRFFPRAVRDSFLSAWAVEAARATRRGKPFWNRTNPFVLYAALAGGFAGLALAIGGAGGLALFGLQAFVAVFSLEVTNYIEHYGLVRKHLGDGRYEPTRPRHSWNANHRVTNWLLLNLQRHSDHHYKPQRRYPLLQTWDEEDAPQLPHGYPLMAFIACNPRRWRRMMNPRVRRWRAMYYPEIIDWSDYKTASTPVRD